MSDAKIIDSIKINFRDSNAQEIRMAAFLRSQKEIGKELKSEIMRSVYSFLDTFAVGADPNSTSSDIETAFITSMISMSSQMSALALYCRLEHQINLSAESWRTFGLLPPPIDRATTRSGKSTMPNPGSYLDFAVDEKGNKLSMLSVPSETTGQRLSRENQERPDEIDQETVNRSFDLSTDVEFFLQEAQPETVDEYDPDYDPEDDLSEEEYLELVNSRMTVNIPVIVD